MQSSSLPNKKQEFKEQIRQRQRQEHRKRIRQAAIKKQQIDNSSKDESIYTQPIELRPMDIKNSSSILNNLQFYSLKHSCELWASPTFLNYIFSVMGAYMIQYDGNQYQQEKKLVLMKIKNIFTKMLTNEIEWAKNSIQYIIIGSSICVPVFINVITGFSKSLIPIHKKNVESSICKTSKTIQNQLRFQKKADLCEHVYSFLKVIQNLYLKVPKIQAYQFVNIFYLFETLVQSSLIAKCITPLQYKNSIFFNKTILNIVTLNLQFLIESHIIGKIMKFLIKIVQNWDKEAHEQNKISFYKMLDKMCEYSDVKAIQQFFKHSCYQICYVFQKQLEGITKLNYVHRNKKLVLSYATALSSYLLSEVEDNVINYKNFSAHNNKLFLQFLSNMIQFFETSNYSQIKQLEKEEAYFYYSIIEILSLQDELLSILSISSINQLLHNKIQYLQNVSELLIWLRVFEVYLCKLHRENLFIGSTVDLKLINLISEIYSSHHHQKVVHASQNILQIISQTNQ